MTIKITNGSILLEIAGNTNQNNKTTIYFEINNSTGLNQVILACINCVPTKKVTPFMYTHNDNLLVVPIQNSTS